MVLYVNGIIGRTTWRHEPALTGLQVGRRAAFAELESWCSAHEQLYPLLAMRAACEQLALQHGLLREGVSPATKLAPGPALAPSLQVRRAYSTCRTMWGQSQVKVVPEVCWCLSLSGDAGTGLLVWRLPCAKPAGGQ